MDIFRTGGGAQLHSIAFGGAFSIIRAIQIQQGVQTGYFILQERAAIYLLTWRVNNVKITQCVHKMGFFLLSSNPAKETASRNNVWSETFRNRPSTELVTAVLLQVILLGKVDLYPKCFDKFPQYWEARGKRGADMIYVCLAQTTLTKHCRFNYFEIKSTSCTIFV